MLPQNDMSNFYRQKPYENVKNQRLSEREFLTLSFRLVRPSYNIYDFLKTCIL